MGFFGRSREEKKERKEIKSQVDKIMKSYDDEEMDSATFMQKMMDYTTSYQKKKKK